MQQRGNTREPKPDQPIFKPYKLFLQQWCPGIIKIPNVYLRTRKEHWHLQTHPLDAGECTLSYFYLSYLLRWTGPLKQAATSRGDASYSTRPCSQRQLIARFKCCEAQLWRKYQAVVHRTTQMPLIPETSISIHQVRGHVLYPLPLSVRTFKTSIGLLLFYSQIVFRKTPVPGNRDPIAKFRASLI